MRALLITALIILLLLAAVLFVPTYLIFEFERDEEGKKTVFRIRHFFWNIRLIPKKNKKNPAKAKDKHKKKKQEMPEKAEEKKEKKSIKERIDNAIAVYKRVEDDVADIILYAKRHAVSVREISVLMRLGLSEAMHTGIATGGLYGFIYNIIALLDYHLGVCRSEVKLQPEFDEECLDVHVRCILKLKNVHIIIIAFRVLRLYFKISKM